MHFFGLGVLAVVVSPVIAKQIIESNPYDLAVQQENADMLLAPFR